MTPTLGLAVIAKDEEASLPRLLASVSGAFDRVALVDTGSTDRTVERFEEWARAEADAGRLDTYAVDSFEWCDDFAAARNHANSLLREVDWICWADCDDEIIGARSLRGVVATAPAEVVAYVADYDYGNSFQARTKRLFRQRKGFWVGRLHEFLVTDEDRVASLPSTVARWVHHQDPDRNGQRLGTRLRICRKWAQDAPGDLHAQAHLAREALVQGSVEESVEAFGRFFELLPAPMPDDLLALAEGRMWMFRMYAAALVAAGRADDALEVARAAFLTAPPSPDHPLTLACLALAEVHHARREWEAAATWAIETLERERPSGDYIEIDEQDYHARPSRILMDAVANAQEEAGWD